MEKQQLRIVFMGTPAFAVASLKAMVDEGYRVVGVITAPDRKAGRGKKLKASAVKEYALKKNLKVLQPENLKDKQFLQELAELRADLQVVVAFRMLPEVVWGMPKLGTFNLHASLLPQYRGAAPINHVLINGEKKTGVTTFFLDRQIDTGRIIDCREIGIDDKDDFGTLHDKLMKAGASLVIETIEKIRKGNMVLINQSELINSGEELHKAPKIDKDFCQVNWKKNPEEIHNFVRGLSPYPCAFTNVHLEKGDQLRMKICKTTFEMMPHTQQVGQIVMENHHVLKVAVKGGYVVIHELQVPGKKRMPTTEFLKGFHGKLLFAG